MRTTRPTRSALPVLLSLSLGYFTLGTCSLAVVGLGAPLGHELHTAPAEAGVLVSVFALTFALAAPLAPAALRRTAAEGDLVFAHSHFTPAPGERGLAVVDIFRIEDGLIAEHWETSEEVPETTASGRPVV